MSVESAFSVCLRGELRVDLTFCDVEPNTPLFPTGVHYVFDTTIAADFSILESQKEFVRRFRQHNEEEPDLVLLLFGEGYQRGILDLCLLTKTQSKSSLLLLRT